MEKWNGKIRVLWLISVIVATTCANAQTIHQEGGNPMQPGNMAIYMCADSDCHNMGPAPVPLEAIAFFSAKTYAATNTLMNQQIQILNSLLQAQNATNQLITNQIGTFNQDLRNSINSRFDSLPAELMTSDAIKQLKTDILQQVDAKLKTQNPAAVPPPIQPAPPPPAPAPAPAAQPPAPPPADVYKRQ